MTKEEILSEYIRYIKLYKKYPSRLEFKSFSGISKDVVHNKFGSMEHLKKAA